MRRVLFWVILLPLLALTALLTASIQYNLLDFSIKDYTQDSPEVVILFYAAAAATLFFVLGVLVGWRRR